MPELFQIFRSNSGMGKKVGSMDLVRLSGGLLVKCWLRNPVQLKLVPLSLALNENSSITLARKRIELMTFALLARRSNQLS